MRSIFKNSKIALVGLLIFTNAFSQSTQIPFQEIPTDYEFTSKIGDVIPDFTMTLLNGKKVSSKDWRGKVVMLQFTASWCGCLLYTSPSPRDGLLARMPSSA